MDLNDLPKQKNTPEVNDAELEALPYAGTSAERTYHQVKSSNPDEAAKIISVANKTGQPVQFVAENFDDVNMDDLKLPSEFWKQMDKQYPGTSKWLSKPENMAVAHDDFDNLPIFERYIKEATFGFRQNSLQNKLSELRGKQMDELRKTGKISPQYQADVTNTKSELQLMEQGAPKGFHPLYQTAAQSVNWGKGALEALKFAVPAAGTGALTALALGQLGPQAALPEELVTVPGAAIAFGKVGAAVGAGNFAYRLERNLAFDQYLDLKDKAGNPLDPKKAANAAELVGVINGALETVGDVVLFKGVAQPIGKAGIAALSKVPGATKVLGYIQKNPAIFAKMTMGQAVRQAVKALMLTEVGEISTEYAQEVMTGAGQNLAISMSGQNISKTPTLDILSQASGVISPTAQAVLIPGLLGGSFNVYNAKKAIAVAEQNAQAFTAMTEATKNSATFKRLPEAYQELVNETIKDGPIDGVWIRPAALEEHLSKQGIDPAQALAEIGIDNKLYQDAKDMGDLKIPMSQWTKIVQSQQFSGIANDIRLHQEDLSVNEAKELESETKKREAEAEKGLQEMVAQTEATTTNDPQTKADWDKIYTRVKTELEAVETKPEEADKNARMWAAVTINQAKARGITVDQLLAGRPEITDATKAKIESSVLQRGNVKWTNENGKIINPNGESVEPKDYMRMRPWQITRDFWIEHATDPGEDFKGTDNARDIGIKAVSEIAEKHRNLISEYQALDDKRVKFLENSKKKRPKKGIDFSEADGERWLKLRSEIKTESSMTGEQSYFFPELRKQEREAGHRAGGLAIHKLSVEQAISEGKSVPPEVLADYPDLAQKAQGPEYLQAAAKATTDSPEFKAWFGDSKVVDEKGQPLVVYHGTNSPVAKLAEGFAFKTESKSINDYGFLGNVPVERSGIFLSASKDFSKEFGSDIVEVYARITNPADINRDIILDFAGTLDPFGSDREMFLYAKTVTVPWKMFDGELGKKFVRYLKDKGYDGATFQEDTDTAGGENIEGTTYIAFSPEQIKSIFNRGTFNPNNPNILMQRGGGPQNLVAVHNLSAEKLLHADKMGGLAVPSLAISRTEHPLKNFGDITLIGNTNLIDPRTKSNKVFNSDIYSPRYPSITYEIDNLAIKKAREFVTKEEKDLDTRLDYHLNSHDFAKNGMKAVADSPIVKLKYLRSIGKDIEIIKKTDQSHYLKLNPDIEKVMDKYSLPYDLRNNKDFLREYEKLRAAEMDAEREDALKAGSSKEDADKIAEQMGRILYDKEGKPNINFIRDIQGEISAREKIGEIDIYATERAIREAMPIEQADYNKWVSEHFGGLVGKEKIFKGFTPSGNRRYVPHTLDNVVLEMKKELQGGEALNYGLGSLRAEVAKRYRTLQQMMVERDKIVSYEEFEKAREIVNEEFDGILDEARKKYTGKADFGTADTFLENLKEGIKRGNIEKELSEYGFPGMDIERIKAFLSTIREMPTEYFEAKLQRAVGLNEFAGAVIPKSAPQSVRDVLKKNDIPFREYEGENRTEVLRQFAQDLNDKGLDILFQSPAESFGEIGRELAPTFYSKLQRTLEAKMPEKASPEQIKGIIKDLKPEELKWSGINDFLAGKDKVSKQELLDFLRGNELQIKEKTISTSALTDTQAKRFTHLSNMMMREPDRLTEQDKSEWQTLADLRNSEPPKFSTYQLPGGENYREILFTLPVAGGKPLTDAELSELNKLANKTRTEDETRRYFELGRRNDASQGNGPDTFHSGHWNESNVLAHTRINDRVDADGKKVLFVEEIQSDWHQAGREKGYQSPDLPKIKNRISELDTEANSIKENNADLRKQYANDTAGFLDALAKKDKRFAEIVSKRKGLYEQVEKAGDIPDAPFRQTIGKGLSGWAGFVLKRMIRYAAENGYDRIAWTTGEQQAERYDLSKQVAHIAWEKNDDGTYNLSAPLPDGRPGIYKEDLSADELRELVGKDVMSKIEAKEGRKDEDSPYRDWRILEGENLKVGGQGMRSFYDQMIPQALNDFGKKFGAKVGETGLNTGTETYSLYNSATGSSVGGGYTKSEAEAKVSKNPHYTMKRESGGDTNAHSLDITPALKEAALYEGFSLFQSAWHGSPHDFDEFSLHKIGSGEGAQAYGWGLYFAGDRSIAEWYKNRLSTGAYSVVVDGKKYTYSNANTRKTAEEYAVSALEDISKVYGYKNFGKLVEQAIESQKGMIGSAIDKALPGQISKTIEVLEKWKGKKGIFKRSKGQLYEVEIPEADKLLDWGKPYSEQSDYVKNKLDIEADLDPKTFAGMTGEQIYRLMSGTPSYENNLGNKEAKAASLNLNAIGIQGIKYLDANSRADGEGSHNYVIFDDRAVEIINKYYQKKSKAPRGFYDPSANIIGLLKNKNRSTFMHESAHYWLQSIYYFVQSGQADEAYLKQWEPMKKFLGIKDEQTTLTRDQQEKFARHMEAYLMEGKSPSIELRDVFASFRQWLLNIYKTVKRLSAEAGFPIEMTPEVRDYFDHLFASEQEIQAARAETGTDISSLPADEQIDTLRKQANAEAMDTLTKVVMKELRADYLKEKRDYKAQFTKEEEQRLRSNPTYSAMETLRKSKAFSGKEPKEISDLYLNGGLTDEDRAQLDSIAVALGHEDGYPLARMISQAVPFGDVLADHVELEMASKYASLEDTPDFREQAIAAIHNDRQLELMALERETLRGMTAEQSDKTVRKPLTEVTRRSANIEAKVIKRKASDLLSSKPYREASQFRIFITAEKNAAIALGRALAKKDTAAAVTAKQHQMFNHALAMESLRIKEQGEGVFEFLSKAGDKTEKLPSSGKLPITAAANIQVNRLLSRFNFADLLSVPEGTPTLAQYVEDLKAHADDVVVADWLLTEGAPVTGWKDLSIEQLLDLKDAVASIKHAGKRENTLSTGESIDSVANAFTAAISANLKAKPNSYDPAARNTIMDTAAKFVNSHRSLSYIFRALDGFKVGEISQFVMGRLRKARHNESIMGAEAVGKLEALWDKHYPAEGNTPFLRWKNRTDMATARIFFNDAATDQVFPKGVTKENLIMMGLNQGTELNKRRLLESYAMQSVNEGGERIWTYRLTQDNVDKMLSRLGENDWKFIQDVLDLVNSYWPKIAELERNRTGLEPRKRSAVAINTTYGNFPGGYFHIEYDPRASEPAQRQSIEDSMKGAIEGSHIIPSTRRGHTKETVNHVYNRPLLLQFSVIDRHLQSVIHDLAFIETIRDLDRVLTNDRVTAAITGTIGEGAYRQIRPALSYVGFENRPQSSPVDAMLSGIRSRASAFYLMFRVTSILSQIAGAGVAMGSVGAHKYVANLVTMTPTKARMILDKSRIMRERLGNRDRDVRDAMRSFMEKGKLNNVTKYGFFLQGYMDIAVAMPQWMAAYEDELQRQVQAGEQTSEDKAITAADETVQSTQGSGDPIDLSAMQRGSEFMKLLTMFYTPFAPLANKQIELWERLQENDVKDIPAVMSFLTFWIVLPGVIAATLSGDLPDGDDDDKSWFTWVIRNSLSQFFGGWVGARDMASYVTNRTSGRDMGYRLSPAETTVEKLLKPMADVGKAMKGGDMELSTIAKNTAESAMLLFKLPGRQISITTGYIIDLMTGEAEFEPQRLIYPQKKK